VVALYDIQPWNGLDLFLELREPHTALVNRWQTMTTQVPVKLLQSVLLRAETEIAVFVEPQRQRIPVGHKKPLTNVELGAVNQQRLLCNSSVCNWCTTIGRWFKQNVKQQSDFQQYNLSLFTSSPGHLLHCWTEHDENKSSATAGMADRGTATAENFHIPMLHLWGRSPLPWADPDLNLVQSTCNQHYLPPSPISQTHMHMVGQCNSWFVK